MKSKLKNLHAAGVLISLSFAWVFGFALVTVWAVDHSFSLTLLDEPLGYIGIDGVRPKEAGDRLFHYELEGESFRCFYGERKEANENWHAPLSCECPVRDWARFNEASDRCFAAVREKIANEFFFAEEARVVWWGNRPGHDELLQKSVAEQLRRYGSGVLAVVLFFLLPAWRLVPWRNEIAMVRSTRFWAGLGQCMIALALMMGLFASVFAYAHAHCFPFWNEHVERIRGGSAPLEFSTIHYIALILSFGVLAFFEELVFRVFLFTRLIPHVGVLLAMLLSSLTFAFCHFGTWVPLPGEELPPGCEITVAERMVFPLASGLVFAFFYWRFNSVILVTLAHLLSNVLLGTVLYWAIIRLFG